MTLGRALFDKRDLEGAKREFEAVLKGAPDNILASRFLSECLEGLGDLSRARSQYQATLAMAPGDRQLAARLENLGKAAAPAPVAAAAAAPPVVAAAAPAAIRASPAPPPPRPPEPPPIPVSAFDEPLEVEPPSERNQTLYPAAAAPTRTDAPGTAETEPPPIPLSAAEEFFELESPFNVPGTGWADRPGEAQPTARGASDSGPADVSETLSSVPEEAGVDFEFDFESGSTAPVPVVAPPSRAERAWVQPEHAVSATPASSPEPIAAGTSTEQPGAEGGEIASTTLAELYFAQGFREKAADVFRQVLKREPGNERARVRLAEIESVQASSEVTSSEAQVVTDAPPAGTDALNGGSRRETLLRTIGRLEGLLETVRRLRH